MKYICPLVTVENIGRSKDFYQRILHQKIKADYGENVVFEGDFSIHLREHYELLLEGHKVRQGGNNFELYFENNDLEKIQLELKAANIDFVHEIRTQPWQQKVLRIYDPDKNIIEIGESLKSVCIKLRDERKTVEEIMEMTSLSKEYILELLK